MRNVRAVFILAVYVAVTFPLMPVQAILLVVSPRIAGRLAHHYHRFTCALMGLRLTVRGEISDYRPLLIAANHTSWLDIPVLSSLAPLSFIAKSEVRTWPLVGWLARLQRTVFVDRTRRSKIQQTTGEMASRLTSGDAIVLFPEGTSGDGSRIQPFRTALFAAAIPELSDEVHPEAPPVQVQPVAIAYVAINGLPMGRQHRPLAAWYGDMKLLPHLWRLLQFGPVDVVIAIGDVLPSDVSHDRKKLAAAAQDAVTELFIGSMDRSQEK